MRQLDANDPYEMMGATVGRLLDVAQKELCDDMRYEWAKAPLVMGTRPVPPIRRRKWGEALSKGMQLALRAIEGREAWIGETGVGHA